MTTLLTLFANYPALSTVLVLSTAYIVLMTVCWLLIDMLLERIVMAVRRWRKQ